MTLTKTVMLTTDEEGGSARPEIVATSNRIFVLYLAHIADTNDRTFSLKIYDTNLTQVLASKVLVNTTAAYGSPTDIRVAADERYLYAFYETVGAGSATSSASHLWGAVYTLDDEFTRVAYTPSPWVSSQSTGGNGASELQAGEEVLDDPAPLVCPEAVFVVTRLYDALAKSGRTVYRARGFLKRDLSLIGADLDLSGVADGRARVASLLCWNDAVYIALPTTTSDQGIDESRDDSAPSDVIAVKLQWDGTPDPRTPAVTLAGNTGDRENYVCGFKTDGRYFFITHRQLTGSSPADNESAWIKVFDGGANLVHQEQVKSTAPTGGYLRPSLDVFGNRVFSGQSPGQSIGGGGNAEIYVYEWADTLASERVDVK